MLCPRCQVQVTDGQCPSCKIVWDPEEDWDRSERAEKAEGGAIPLEMSASKSESPTSAAAGSWRNELKKRLDEHSSRGKDRPDSDPVSPVTPAEEPPPRIGDAPAILFDYKISRPRGREPLENPVRHREERATVPRSPLLDLPLSRPAGREKPSAPKDAAGSETSRQRTLNLEPTPPPPTPDAEKEPPETEPSRVPREERVSGEILLSRFLCGLIDVSLPLGMGFGFSLLAAWMLDVDFFAGGLLVMSGVLALVFFLFNSAFFLLTAGRTPGMMVAQLDLAPDGDLEEVPWSALLLRVVLFLPSALSVLGLAWAIFDPARRCTHDVLSGTRVVYAKRTR